MKKFFSILCAMAIVLSASAVPAKILGSTQKLNAKELKAMKDAKAPLKNVKMVSSLQKAERSSVALRAPQAKQEDYNIEITDYAEKFYSADNDVYVKLYDADGNTYVFDIIVAAGTQELALGQAYTLGDMIANYSYMKDAAGNYVEYASASFTKTLVPYEEQQLVHINAAFADTLGNNYTLVYEEAPFIITGDTIEVNFTEIMNKPVFAEGLCQLHSANESMDIAFTFNVADEGVAAGTYGPDDMNLQYTYVNDLEAKEAHCVVTENNGRIDLEGWILAKDGNVYHVTMFFETPTVQSQVTITASNLVLDDTYASWFGIIIASASNEDYSVSAYLSADDYLGTFGADEIELTIEDAEGEIDLFDGTVTIANTADGIVITGTALSMDGVEFTLNLSYVVPEATSQENLSLSGTLTDIQGQAWQFMGQTSDKYVSIAAYSTSIPGTYGRADLAADYTYVVKFVGADTLYYDMVDANIVVAVSGTNATITGTLKGQNYDDASDVIEFILNLTATVEEYEEQQQGNQYDAQDEAFKYIFPEYNIDDQYLAQYGVFVVEAQNAENAYISIEINVPEGTTALQAGEYPVSAQYEDNTVSAGSIDQYIYGSFAGYLNASGDITVPLWLFNEGSVTILENGVIQVNVTNTWGAQVHCQLGSWPEAIDNTEADVKATKLVRNGQLLIIKNGVEYNAQGATLK
ncbi:MAG: hypothetical protein IJS57_07060 [Paludibacteraceae bacterium]|nr:hypothetical protein [Paludibacteraceae bacterium]